MEQRWETCWQRACRDTERFRKSGWSFWAWEVVGVAVFGVVGAFVGYWLTPLDSNPFGQFAYPTIGGGIGVVVGFVVVFSLIFGWNLYHAPYRQRNEARTKVEQYEQEKNNPNIEVKPLILDNRAVLEVQNNGIDANFTAEAIVVKGVPPKIRYTMCWDSPPHLEHPIKRGGKSTIRVAEKESAIMGMETPGIVKNGLVLFQIGISGEVKRVGATTQELRSTVELNIRYPSMAKPVDDSCTIEITITSTPPLLTPFNNRKYIVKIDHEQAHKLLFTPLPESNPDKEGSQS